MQLHHRNITRSRELRRGLAAPAEPLLQHACGPVAFGRVAADVDAAVKAMMAEDLGLPTDSSSEAESDSSSGAALPSQARCTESSDSDDNDEMPSLGRKMETRPAQ